jgi:hypothetical protein
MNYLYQEFENLPILWIDKNIYILLDGICNTNTLFSNFDILEQDEIIINIYNAFINKLLINHKDIKIDDHTFILNIMKHNIDIVIYITNLIILKRSTFISSANNVLEIQLETKEFVQDIIR